MDLAPIIVIAVIVLLVVFAIGIYNSLVQKRLRIDEAFAQIEVQLKRRHDLIPNLVNAVKGYMGFEQKVLTDVTNARAAAVAARCLWKNANTLFQPSSACSTRYMGRW